jgi:hypothetical protein
MKHARWWAGWTVAILAGLAAVAPAAAQEGDSVARATALTGSPPRKVVVGSILTKFRGSIEDRLAVAAQRS